MEPLLLQFLNRIMRTIGLVVFWMSINVAFGIMWGYAFIETEWKLGNVLFYLFLLLSFIGFAYTLYR
jgi:ABC-type glycerol-3-phosphate transport system permease component